MSSTETMLAVKFENGTRTLVSDTLTREAALQICINETPFTMTMRTPGNEQALVRGLLLSENVVGRVCSSYRYQATGIEPETGDVNAVNVLIHPKEILSGYNLERSLMSVSSCGICGKQDAAELMPMGVPLTTDIQIHSKMLHEYFQDMAGRQTTFIHSGGSHAAAAYSNSGTHLAIHEDIGRHNAVDKVIGQLLLDERLDEAAILLVSGRVSFEIISKTYRAGIPVLAAVSAPSALSVKVAEELGITLVAFCRDGKSTVYSHNHRIV